MQHSHRLQTAAPHNHAILVLRTRLCYLQRKAWMAMSTGSQGHKYSSVPRVLGADRRGAAVASNAMAVRGQPHFVFTGRETPDPALLGLVCTSCSPLSTPQTFLAIKCHSLPSSWLVLPHQHHAILLWEAEDAKETHPLTY